MLAKPRPSKIVSWVSMVLGERRKYADTRSWLIAVRNRVIMVTRGPRPGRKPIVTVRHVRLKDRVHVRMGSPDLWVLDEIFLHGEYRSVASADLGEVRQVVDLGTNAGLSVRFWLSRWPEARVIGVEPDPHNFEVASRNAKEHRGGTQVRLVQACVAASERTVSLNRTQDETKYVMTEMKSDERGTATGDNDIIALPLGKILEQNGALPTIDLMKVDIEGAEREVFEHCADWIRRVRFMVLEVHPPYTPEQLLEDCARNGRRFEVIERYPSDPNVVVFLRAVE